MTEHGFSLRQQIEELELEVRYRKKVFPNLVRKREMTQSHADYRMGRISAAIETLWRLQDDEITRIGALAIAFGRTRRDVAEWIQAQKFAGRSFARAENAPGWKDYQATRSALMEALDALPELKSEAA